MTTRHRLTNYSRAIYADAHTVAARIDAAVASMEQSMGGYPSSTPGAAPSTSRSVFDPDGPVTLTATERLAATIDHAQVDLEAFTAAMKEAHRHLATAAVIALRWGTPRVDDTVVRKRLSAAVTADHGIWCRNCARHGHRNPKAEGRTECDFCASFRQSYGLDAPKAVFDARDSRGGRIFVQDIERILDRDHPGWRKNAPKGKARKSA